MDLRKPFDTIKDGLGFAMIFGHGYDKLMKFFSGEAIEFMSFLGVFSPKISFGLVVFSEFFCSIFLILGLFTRWAAFFLLFTMCVAVFYKHYGHDFDVVEKGFLYLVGYVAIFLAGAGNLSLDAKFERSH